MLVGAVGVLPAEARGVTGPEEGDPVRGVEQDLAGAQIQVQASVLVHPGDRVGELSGDLQCSRQRERFAPHGLQERRSGEPCVDDRGPLGELGVLDDPQQRRGRPLGRPPQRAGLPVVHEHVFSAALTPEQSSVG